MADQPGTKYWVDKCKRLEELYDHKVGEVEELEQANNHLMLKVDILTQALNNASEKSQSDMGSPIRPHGNSMSYALPGHYSSVDEVTPLRLQFVDLLAEVTKLSKQAEELRAENERNSVRTKVAAVQCNLGELPEVPHITRGMVENEVRKRDERAIEAYREAMVWTDMLESLKREYAELVAAVQQSSIAASQEMLVRTQVQTSGRRPRRQL